jgi:hypothetical protein
MFAMQRLISLPVKTMGMPSDARRKKLVKPSLYSVGGLLDGALGVPGAFFA